MKHFPIETELYTACFACVLWLRGREGERERKENIDHSSFPQLWLKANISLWNILTSQPAITCHPTSLAGLGSTLWRSEDREWILTFIPLDELLWSYVQLTPCLKSAPHKTVATFQFLPCLQTWTLRLLKTSPFWFLMKGPPKAMEKQGL